MKAMGRASRLKVFFLLFDVFRQLEANFERQRQVGLRCHRKYSLFPPVTDSVKDFKFNFFYMVSVNKAAKKEIAELNNQGEVVNNQFSLSWCKEHFDLEMVGYSYEVCELSRQEARTLKLLTDWL